jgi:hypothetical protein
VPGLLINEISIQRHPAARAAVRRDDPGSDNKTYVIKTGDRLLDGTVKSIVLDVGGVLAGRQRSALARQAERNSEKL